VTVPTDRFLAPVANCTHVTSVDTDVIGTFASQSSSLWGKATGENVMNQNNQNNPGQQGGGQHQGDQQQGGQNKPGQHQQGGGQKPGQQTQNPGQKPGGGQHDERR
jgi:hypothetical protein